MQSDSAPVALVTGVGRSAGIAASIVAGLRDDGWRVATCGWRDYDARMPWGADPHSLAEFEADLADPNAPARLMGEANRSYGSMQALVMCHCESVDSAIVDTTVESFDRHFAVNARSIWLLIRAFAEQFDQPPESAVGRIVALTSDHTAFNLPYGASKGALDRIVLAAAVELAPLGLTANVVNPGAVDTGWMSDDVKQSVAADNLQPRIGQPHDCASLVRFLCSPAGGWINGQLLYSDGGRRRG